MGDCSWCFSETAHIVVHENPRAATGCWGVFAQEGFKVWNRIPQVDKVATSQID